MPTPLLHRLQQVAFELEASEGVAETPAAIDADLLVYDVDFEANIEKVERNPARSSLTPLQKVMGKQFARVSFSVEVKGSGAVGTAPSWGKCLKACSMQESAVQTIAIGAITGGPFRPGELITGGTSGGIGLVVDRIATGSATVPYVVISGVLQSGEVLTGEVSGATATSSGAPTASQGWNYRPRSTGDSAATIAFYHDGKRKKLYGARGNVRGSFTNGALGMLNFEFDGIWDSDADATMLVPTYESVVPVSFLDVAAYIDSFAFDFTSLEFDLGNARQYVETAQAAKGARYVRIAGRTPTLTIDPYATLVADFDWLGKLAGSTTSMLRAQLNTAAGNKVVVAAGALSYDQVRQQQKGLFQGYGVTLQACTPTISRGDNELLISML